MDVFDLDDLQMEMLSLEGKGYHCSQILILLALRQTGGERNDSLIRSMGGLSSGSVTATARAARCSAAHASLDSTPGRGTTAKRSTRCSG